MRLLSQDDHIDIDTVAGELYSLAPSEFTSRRDARAAEARRAGDKALAAEIKKLRRPTTGAWLANLLTRERGQPVAGLLDLGAALRAAQAQLATDDLRRLSLERHHQVAELEREARGLAGQHGQAVSEAAAQELAATLEAALADEDAANALRAGRLTTGLHYSGLGPVGAGHDGSDGFEGQKGVGAAGPAGEPPSTPVEQARGRPQPSRPGPSAENRSRLGREAKAALAKAEAAVAKAEQDAKDKRAHLSRAKDERGRRAREIADLERRLQALREAEEKAAGEVRAAEEALDAAERAVLGAQDELARLGA
jgi:hypothetical protein